MSCIFSRNEVLVHARLSPSQKKNYPPYTNDQGITESSDSHTDEEPALFPLHKPQFQHRTCFTPLPNALKTNRILWTLSCLCWIYQIKLRIQCQFLQFKVIVLNWTSHPSNRLTELKISSHLCTCLNDNPINWPHFVPQYDVSKSLCSWLSMKLPLMSNIYVHIKI